MQKLEINDSSPDFVAQDTSELIAITKVVLGFEGERFEPLKARVQDMLIHVVIGEMIPEQEPFTGEDAQHIIAAMKVAVRDRATDEYSKAAFGEMLAEYDDPSVRPYILARQRQVENGLTLGGEPPIAAKLRPLAAWRAPSANVDTADLVATEAAERAMWEKIRNAPLAPDIPVGRDSSRDNASESDRVDLDSLLQEPSSNDKHPRR